MLEFLDEWDYLIHLVRCTIHDQQPQELPETLDFTRVYECGVYHHIANIAFYSVEKLVSKPHRELYAKWEACRDQAFVRDINQSYAAEEIREAFRCAGIRSLEVQGTKIKPLYPLPEYRTMSDLDFIIDPQNLTKAKTALEGLGYQCKITRGVEVDGFRAPNINIEVHTEYFAEFTDYHKVLRPPFSTLEETGEYDINEFYLYNILHIARHYLFGGCGIRRVLDVYFLNKAFSQIIDREYVRSVLKEAEVTDLAAELSELAQQWFGQKEAPAHRSQAARYILVSGLHGTIPHALDTLVEKTYNSNTRFSRVKYFLRRLWGTKKILYMNYPILEKYKILYPFCWLHRAFLALHPRKLRRLRAEMHSINSKK